MGVEINPFECQIVYSHLVKNVDYQIVDYLSIFIPSKLSSCQNNNSVKYHSIKCQIVRGYIVEL